MLFYFKTGCPYCAKVIKKLEELYIKYDVKNRDDEGVIDELIARGGKRQFPYMVDEEAKVEMYESDDIVDYLDKKYGKGGDKPARVVVADGGICEI